MTQYYLEATDVDEGCWIELPTQWPMPDFEDMFPDPVPWAGAAARVTWKDSGLTPGPGDVEALAKTLEYCARTLPDRLPGFEIFLHLPTPSGTPQAVYVGDYRSDGDPDAELREVLGLDQPNAVETPLVEDFTVPTLGTGKRAVRYAKDADGAIIASLRYAWNVEEHGTIASVRTAGSDPARIVSMAEDLDRLCKGLRYLPEEMFPE